MVRVGVLVGAVYGVTLAALGWALVLIVSLAFPEDCPLGSCDADLRVTVSYLVGVPLVIGLSCVVWSTVIQRLTSVPTDIVRSGWIVLFTTTIGTVIFLGPLQWGNGWQIRIVALAAMSAGALAAWCARPASGQGDPLGYRSRHASGSARSRRPREG